MDKGKSGAAKPKARLQPLLEDRRRLYGLLGAAAIVVFAVILLASGGDEESSPSGGGAPQVLDVDSLRETVSAHEPPVYWAGEQQDTELELSEPEPGQTYIRYLTGDAEAGDERADFLTVGTYAQADPVTALRRQGKEPGGVLAKAPGDATVFFDSERPSSVYLAYPGVEAQIEVYAPDFEEALELVNSGQIVPVS